MKPLSFQTLIGAALAATVMVTTGQEAQALNLKGWDYSIDSAQDGTQWNSATKKLIIGDNSAFEFYGMASKQTDTHLVFAFSSNLSLNGYSDNNAQNKKISYGDFFLNFTDTNSFDNANGQLFGVRFDLGNDTRFTRTVTTVDSRGRTRTSTVTEAPTAGLYGNVTATSLTTKNSGYKSMDEHTAKVSSLGGSASYGDLAANTTYFNGGSAAPTNMKSGDLLGAIQMLTSSDLNGMGLNFGGVNAQGDYTFGFSIEKSLLPVGNFVASLFAECGNDGMVMAGSTSTAVPEPTTIAGTLIAGAIGASRMRRRRKQGNPA